jgi:hypothetical protein
MSSVKRSNSFFGKAPSICPKRRSPRFINLYFESSDIKTPRLFKRSLEISQQPNVDSMARAKHSEGFSV